MAALRRAGAAPSWSRAGVRSRAIARGEATHGLRQPAPLRGRPRAPRPPRAGVRAGEPRARARRDPAPPVCRRRPGRAVRARGGQPVPRGLQPLRHPSARALRVPRHPSPSTTGDRAQDRSARGAASSVALRRRTAHRPALAALAPSRWPRARRPYHDLPAPGDPLVAPRRRPVHHPAAGAHPAPGRPRDHGQQPGHVPGAADGQRLRDRPRGGPALPDPSRHRSPPRGGPRSRRVAAGEHLRGGPPPTPSPR